MSEDPKVRGELADKFKSKANLALDAITPEKLAQAGVKDLALVAGISVDKAQLLEGQPTQVHEHVRARESLELAAAQLLEKLHAIGNQMSIERARELIVEVKPEYRQLLPPQSPV